MTTENLCLTPKPDEPHVLCMGPKGHRVNVTMHGNGDLRWWDGVQPDADAGAQAEGAAVASPVLVWLDQRRQQRVVIRSASGQSIGGALHGVMVEPDETGVLHPDALVVADALGEWLVPWASVSGVYHSTDRD